ncbi:MarR family winged helix-turn-helix transcriptional regulator [Rhizobium sp. BE258]|uniref:MarR family winged helix-turn-helix transcriptional regulator n=1 Tax=Rhizobium sp. BE258 TaxID=2817722 RepID=UPI000DD7139A|nr:MarR family winged helix-turn-helix transcriptional regulator [Rhizobium sp. BE258]MDR7145041.1 DNA-binding MarR family transcriptional regulator [Rhizobium sp. BE258]
MPAKKAKTVTEPDIPSLCNCTKVRRAARTLTRFYDECIAESGVKITQYSLLGYLKHRGPKTMLELADLMAMDRATVGHNLRPLERDGLVTIEVSEKDKRARIVSVTKKGLECITAGRPGWDRAQAAFDRAFGAAAAENLRETMDTVVDVELA